MAGWRASAAMKDLAKGKEREGGKRLRADGAAEGSLALGPSGGSSQPSALGAPGASRGTRAPNNESGLRHLTDRVDALSKLSLETHDAVREVQAKLGYVCYIFPKAHAAVTEVESEIGKFRDLVRAARAKSEDSGDPPELIGAQAAHIYPVLLETLDKTVVKTDATTEEHRATLKEMIDDIEISMNPDQMRGVLGTFLYRKGHGDKRKCIVAHNLPEKQALALDYFLLQAGAEKKTGKPPRSGPARGVQQDLDRAQERKKK